MLMRRTVQIISWFALAGTIVPPIAFLAGSIAIGPMKVWMLAATVVWFVATPLWMGQEKPEASS